MATTTNYGWTTPDDTALVKDGAAAIRSLGTAIDTSFAADEGDLLVGGTSDIFEALPIGAAGTVLTSDGDTAEWVAPAAGGGMTLLSTTAITAVSEISITSIDQTYTDLVIVLENAATSGTAIAARLGFNANTTSGQYSYLLLEQFGGGAIYINNSSQRLELARAYLSTTANTNSIVSAITIPRYTNTTRKTINWSITGISNSASAQGSTLGTGSFLGSAAISSVELSVSSGTWTAQGNIYIYGVK